MAFIKNRRDALLIIREFSELQVPPELCEQLIHCGEANDTNRGYSCSARYISLNDLLHPRYSGEKIFWETSEKSEGSYEEFLAIICKKYEIESLNGNFCLNFKVLKYDPNGDVTSEHEFYSEPFNTILYKASTLLQEYYEVLKERKQKELADNRSAYEKLTDACKKMFDGED